MNILNERIKQSRLARGLTLAQVADAIGVKEATAQRYESGDIKNIKHETILRLSEIFSVSPAYLMGWTDEPYLYDKEKAAPADGDGLSPLDAQLMDLLRFLTDDQKKLLLAQIDTLLKSQ
ncbi:helix-turn-helix domain-containing protein [Oscillibacter ruminantium]|nr:helix-turn-helix transcriptional regulator [Oscillibacter valericigenes]